MCGSVCRMTIVLLVGLGGFTGSVIRYLLGVGIRDLSAGSAFPWATLVVNVVGALLIGALYGAVENRSFFTPEVRGLLTIGLLGGFTTFSAFSYETLTLLRDGVVAQAFANVVLQMGLGLLAVWIGYTVAHRTVGV